MIIKAPLKFVAVVMLGSLTFGSISSLNASAAALTTKTMKKSEIPIMEQLRLDEKQKRSIQASRTKRTIAIKKVLTNDQGTKFDRLRGKQKLPAIIGQLNLDTKQKTAVMAAIEQAQKEIKDILNTTQRKQLEDYLAKNKQTAE
ncbi:MAG: hypothetical protein LH631_12510 [Alkalinema sp. CAN_BIN05]|nr:hypothetical protein [Alkalinema sp. CAN_BIN05]